MQVLNRLHINLKVRSYIKALDTYSKSFAVMPTVKETKHVQKHSRKPVIARPWSQMHNAKRRRGRRIRSPNHESHLLARGYDDLAKVCNDIVFNVQTKIKKQCTIII